MHVYIWFDFIWFDIDYLVNAVSQRLKSELLWSAVLGQTVLHDCQPVGGMINGWINTWFESVTQLWQQQQEQQQKRKQQNNIVNAS